MAKMKQTKRKRTITNIDLDRAIKLLRNDSRVKEDKIEHSVSQLDLAEEPLQERSERKATFTLLNSSIPSPSMLSIQPRWRSMFGTDPRSSNHTPQDSPFRYQPLEEYRRAEALRLVFLKHGLHYKEPQVDVDLLSEESLSTYMTQWEECLAHWYPILGTELPGNQVKSTLLDLPALSPTNTSEVQPKNPTSQVSLAKRPKAGNNSVNEARTRSIFGNFSFEAPKHGFNLSVAGGDVNLFGQDRFRQMIESEVRRQLNEKMY